MKGGHPDHPEAELLEFSARDAQIVAMGPGNGAEAEDPAHHAAESGDNDRTSKDGLFHQESHTIAPVDIFDDVRCMSTRFGLMNPA